jgi:hypothetical protein
LRVDEDQIPDEPVVGISHQPVAALRDDAADDRNGSDGDIDEQSDLELIDADDDRLAAKLALRGLARERSERDD